MTEQIRGDRALAALADSRDRSAIRDWVSNGCPHSICKEDSNNTRIYIVDEVVDWCRNRGIDFYSKDAEPTALQQQKLRQETHKANDLEDKEKIRRGEWASVQEFEETTVVLLQQVKRLMVEVVGEVKKEAKLKGSAAEQIDAKLISGFNRIADIDLGE